MGGEKGIVHTITDGWANILTSMGVRGKDKRVSASITYCNLDQQQCEELVAQDDVAHKVVYKVPSDGTRKWIELQNIEDIDEKKSICEFMDELCIQKKFQEAWEWARLYGGSAIFIGFDDNVSNEELSNPVDFKRVKTIFSLTVLHRWELHPNLDIETDLNNKNFGMPKTYRLSSEHGGATAVIGSIHYSRLIRFEGQKLPLRLFRVNQYWHSSVLQTLDEPLKNYVQANNAATGVLLDMRVSVLKIQNLAAQIASGTKENIKKMKGRVNVLDIQKSILNTVIIDAQEDYQNSMTSLAGIKDTVSLANNRLVAATGLPHTIVLGESPSGLGATGDSENRDYYDFVSHEQKSILSGPIKYIVEAIMQCSDGPTEGKIIEDWGFDFKPLWQQDDKERAETEKLVAEKDEIYLRNNVLVPSEVLKSRFGGTTFSQDTVIEDLDERLKTAAPLPPLNKAEEAAITTAAKVAPQNASGVT